jgi:hypothetical protein
MEPARVTPPPRDVRVPVRNPEVRGPLDVYYYDHLAEALGTGAGADVTGSGGADVALTPRPNGEVLAYEALNLVDGRRTVSAIRDVLTGRYAPLPTAELAEYLELLARARVISWR